MNTHSSENATVSGQEWTRLPKPGSKLEGLGRTEIYELLKRGCIRSKSLRKPGKVSKCRLIHLPSLRAFIEKFGEEFVPEPTTTTVPSTTTAAVADGEATL